MKRSLFNFTFLFLTTAHLVYPGGPLEDAKYWFNLRAEGSEGLRAKPDPINKAIGLFEQACLDSLLVKEAGGYLLWSFFYKGCFVDQTENEKLKTFDHGSKVGEVLAAKFHDCAAIQFWYIACLGKWSELKGGWAAASSGVIGKLKNACERIISSKQPYYQDAGAYRTLAILHSNCPYIPFILSWPDNDEALKFAEISIKKGPENPGNTVSYAQILYKQGMRDKAVEVLKNIAVFPARKDYRLEDLKEIEDGKRLLEEYRRN